MQAFRDECSAPLRFHLLAGRGIDRGITGSRVQEAGLALAGEVFPSGKNCVRSWARPRWTTSPSRIRRGSRRSPNGSSPAPCRAPLSSDRSAPGLFVEAAERASVPLFASDLPAAGFLEEAGRHLYRLFTETATVHGVLLEVIGVGVLLSGRSGIGKSECALDLVLRGHRFVADDMIHVDSSRPGHPRWPRGRSHLPAHGDPGLGIINIRDLFGATATTRMKKMELVIRIEEWDPSREYDRLGLDDGTVGDPRRPTSLPSRPGLPGRNLATIVEVAVRNHLLKRSGVPSAREFVERQARAAPGSGSP